MRTTVARVLGRIDGAWLAFLAAACAATPEPRAPTTISSSSTSSSSATDVLAAVNDAPASAPVEPAAVAIAAVAEPSPEELPEPALADVALLDQDGRSVSLRTDLAAGRILVMNFVFTRCATVCPPLAANFARVQELLADTMGDELRLASVSVDPLGDTPERMKAFGERFGARAPGWTLLTGEKREIERVLKALGVFTASREGHTSLALVLDQENGRWRWIDGLAPPETIAAVVLELREARAPKPEARSAAHDYFTDVELVDHEGNRRRFYSDLVRDRIVVIDCFFAECTGVCPILARNMGAVQRALGERLGRDVHLLSLTVDPLNDTPERLAEYARASGALPGWSFLTGPVDELRTVLGKLGFQVESREQHSNMIIVGNDRTGLWKKVFGLADPEEVVRIVRSVVEDDGATARSR